MKRCGSIAVNMDLEKNKFFLKNLLTSVGAFGIIYKRHRERRSKNKQNKYLERYRSGHNEAVLKTVCPQGRVGSNPTLSVTLKISTAESKVVRDAWRSTQVAEGARLESE